MDQDKSKIIKIKRSYKKRKVESPQKGPGKKGKKRKDQSPSVQHSKQIIKRPYNKKPKDQLLQSHKGRPSSAANTQKVASNLIHIEVGNTQIKQNISKNSQFNPKGLAIIDKLSEFANNYLLNPPKNEELKKKKKLTEDNEWNMLCERKKKYFNISNNFPYLKYFDENINKDNKQQINEESNIIQQSPKIEYEYDCHIENIIKEEGQLVEQQNIKNEEPKQENTQIIEEEIQEKQEEIKHLVSNNIDEEIELVKKEDEELKKQKQIQLNQDIKQEDPLQIESNGKTQDEEQQELKKETQVQYNQNEQDIKIINDVKENKDIQEKQS